MKRCERISFLGGWFFVVVIVFFFFCTCCLFFVFLVVLLAAFLVGVLYRSCWSSGRNLQRHASGKHDQEPRRTTLIRRRRRVATATIILAPTGGSRRKGHARRLYGAFAQKDIRSVARLLEQISRRQVIGGGRDGRRFVGRDIVVVGFGLGRDVGILLQI